VITHPCPGCLRVTSRPGRCVECGGGTTTQRGYGTDWRQRRARQLLRHPTCQWIVSLPSFTCRLRATDVDHIVPKVHGGTDDASNLQSLCAAHHGCKTATLDRRAGIDLESRPVPRQTAIEVRTQDERSAVRGSAGAIRS
jgi:5-methylcytosine-specific restriction endonuclease McrA